MPDRLTRQHIKAIEQTEVELLRAHAKALAGALAEAAGYLASVRTDRQMFADGDLFALQTLEWANGAKEFAAKANELLEAYDNNNA